MFLTSTNSLGINASREYGGEVYPAAFSPPCDAYAPTISSDPEEEGTTYFHATAADASLHALFKPITNTNTKSIFPALFFRKVVNQPIFGNGKMCNAQLRMFNTSLSTGSYAPRPVNADIRVSMPFLSGEMEWSNAVGMQVDTPFIEQHLVSCEGFRGYEWEDDSPTTSSTTGSGVAEHMESALMNVAAANSSAAQQSPALTLSTMLANYMNAITPAKQVTL
jgi:hypothetical protein